MQSPQWRKIWQTRAEMTTRAAMAVRAEIQKTRTARAARMDPEMVQKIRQIIPAARLQSLRKPYRQETAVRFCCGLQFWQHQRQQLSYLRKREENSCNTV